MRNPVLRPKLARRGMRTQHTLNEHFWSSVRSAAIIIATLLGGLALWNTSVLSEVAYTAHEQQNKIEHWVISCLQHGAAYINSELHLCKPANVWIEKGKDLK